jgi:hypothetical protein
MSNISLDKNLVPGQEVEVLLRMTIFGEEVEDTIKIPVPQAPLLVNKLKGIKMTVAIKDRLIGGDNRVFNCNAYKNKKSLSENRYLLYVRLNSNKKKGELQPDDKVIINFPGAGLNSVQGVRTKQNKELKNAVHFSVNKDFSPNPSSSTTISGTVQELERKIKQRDITVELPDGLLKTLVSEKPTSPPKKGNVEDIVIFAFKQFNGPNKASIKYRIMDGDEKEINLKNPPPRSDVVQFVGKKSKTKSFVLNDEKGEKVLCYIAIARYIYDGENWKGEWLQTNNSGNVIFGKAG